METIAFVAALKQIGVLEKNMKIHQPISNMMSLTKNSESCVKPRRSVFFVEEINRRFLKK